MEDKDEHVEEVYAHFGLAIYFSQVLEHGLVNALVYTYLIPSKAGKIKSRQQWATELDSFMGQRFELTLGGMVRSLKTHLTVRPDLESLLVYAVKMRNRLAHKYLRERSDDFLSYSGREKMTEELKDIQQLFKKADAKLEEAIRPLREEWGFTDEVIKKEFEEMKREAGCDL
jgi:hypothetical protein